MDSDVFRVRLQDELLLSDTLVPETGVWIRSNRANTDGPFLTSATVPVKVASLVGS